MRPFIFVWRLFPQTSKGNDHEEQQNTEEVVGGNGGGEVQINEGGKQT
jgi:hypothetical protein